MKNLQCSAVLSLQLRLAPFGLLYLFAKSKMMAGIFYHKISEIVQTPRISGIVQTVQLGYMIPFSRSFEFHMQKSASTILALDSIFRDPLYQPSVCFVPIAFFIARRMWFEPVSQSKCTQAFGIANQVTAQNDRNSLHAQFSGLNGTRR